MSVFREKSFRNRDFPLQVSYKLLIFAARTIRKELDMTTLLMILGGCVIGLVIGLMDPAPPKKPRKPKKKNFFVRMGEGDVTYPGYTVHND